MFAALPSDLTALKLAVEALDAPEVSSPPPDMRTIGERLRVLYDDARFRSYENLPRRAIRELPYAYWVDGRAVLSAEHPDLVRLYWVDHLRKAISADPRRAKRWLRPLFFTFCSQFSQTDSEFLVYAEKLVEVIAECMGSYADQLRQLHYRRSFFDPVVAPSRLAVDWLDSPMSLDRSLIEDFLWPEFLDTTMGLSAFDTLLGLSENRLGTAVATSRVLDWAMRLSAPVVKSDARVRFADAVLGAWSRQSPPDEIRSALIRFFVGQYGDPRLEGYRNNQWRGVSEGAVNVLMRCLAGDTLSGFIGVLERTADVIWQYRKKFWMAYYDAGHVHEAWLALGSDAHDHAQALKARQQGIGYGRLTGAKLNQSVLLLKIGDLVFTEWSHDGSLRAYRDGAQGAPQLYQSEYAGNLLRWWRSLDFHRGMNMNPELEHRGSVNGTWQRKARDFIRFHTGVHMNDWDVL